MPPNLAYIPGWRADETLYSWVAGFHATYGNGSASDTGVLLFGARHACKEKDAPVNLRHFAEITHGALGDAQSILIKRTSIGLYVPFLPAPRQKVLADRFCGTDSTGWRTLCGMPASRLADPQSLNYCEACVASDVQTWGQPRWRLPHQLIGAWVCLDHGCALRTLVCNSWQWHLPPSKHIAEDTHIMDRPQREMLQRLAKLALRLIDSAPLNIESIRQAALVGLRDQRVTSWAYPLDKSQLASWFSKAPIATWLLSSKGPWACLASGNWIHDLLRNRVADHPLKWMLLWTALFADDDEEVSHRRFLDPEATPHWDASGQGTIWGGYNSTVPLDIQRVIREALTLEDAAHSIGLTVHSLRRRLADLGTNARVFRLGTSFERRKSRAMAAISAYIGSNPTCARSDIHRNCKAAVSWIRANDPEQLSLAIGRIDNSRSRQLQLLPNEEMSNRNEYDRLY